MFLTINRRPQSVVREILTSEGKNASAPPKVLV
jgi:hypothetical protein